MSPPTSRLQTHSTLTENLEHELSVRASNHNQTFTHSIISHVFAITQVKIWSTSENKTNFTTTVVTENLDCNNQNLILYTAKNYKTEENLRSGVHFSGKYKMMRYESTTVENNKNICVFRQICEENCYYVYPSVRNVPGDTTWKICEVLFN